ncbi:MAG: hypothetical protein R2799_05040 [Crocinitomicaceae bacterium]
MGIFIRGNFFIPDARALWVRPSVKYLTNYLKENPVDAIFSDGPPHTNTLIACKVSKNTGIQFLQITKIHGHRSITAEFNMSAVADYIHKNKSNLLECE